MFLKHKFVAGTLVVGSIMAFGYIMPVMNASSVAAESQSEDARHAAEKEAEEAKHKAEKLTEEAKHAAEKRAEALKKLQEKKKELAEKQKELEDKRSKIKERIEGKLDEAKKRTCENRLETIKRIMANAGTNGSKHFSSFNNALERIQDFYTDKELSVGNYDTLVANITAKKTAALAAIEAVKADISFNCDGDNPVASADAFNSKVRAMHQALKDYRSALKELLQAVKTAAKAKEGES